MAGATLAADGGLSDITNLLSLVKDQKTSSSTSTNISKEGVTQQINDILQSTSGLAAVAGAQKTAGLYNSSTNTQLTNDLLARASAQVAARNATQTTTQTKKASVTKQNVEGLLTATALKKLVGSDVVKNGAKSAYESIADELGIAAGANNTATADALSSVAGAGPGAQIGDFTTLESSLANGGDVNALGAVGNIADSVIGAGSGATAAGVTDASVGTLADTGSLVTGASVGTGAGIAGDASIGALADTGGLVSGASVVTGAGELSGAADVAGLAAADSAAVAGEGAAAGLASGAGEGAAATGVADLGIGALGLIGAAAIPLVGGISKAIGSGDINDVGDVYGQFGHWAGDRLQGVGDSIGDVAKGAADATGWIVCTELLRQGKFNRRHYAIGLRVFQSYPQHLTCGYYLWAIPLVAHIRSNPNSRITAISQYLFSARAEYLAARAGVSGAMDTMCNQSISALMYGMCWVLGQALHMRSVLKNWKEKGNSHGWN